MKKKLAFILSGVIAIGILGFGVLYSSTSQAEASLSTEDIKTMVNDQYPGEITEIEQETEFNRAVYEVEIKTEDREYDIKLDGETGEILNISETPVKNKTEATKEEKKETEEIEKDQPQDVVIKEKENEKSDKDQDKKQTEQEKNEKKQAIISIEEAKRIELEEFSGEIDDIELDIEDRRLIYEDEIERGDKEPDIEIDAYTREIIVIEMDED